MSSLDQAWVSSKRACCAARTRSRLSRKCSLGSQASRRGLCCFVCNRSHSYPWFACRSLSISPPNLLCQSRRIFQLLGPRKLCAAKRARSPACLQIARENIAHNRDSNLAIAFAHAMSSAKRDVVRAWLQCLLLAVARRRHWQRKPPHDVERRVNPASILLLLSFALQLFERFTLSLLLSCFPSRSPLLTPVSLARLLAVSYFTCSHHAPTVVQSAFVMFQLVSLLSWLARAASCNCTHCPANCERSSVSRVEFLNFRLRVFFIVSDGFCLLSLPADVRCDHAAADDWRVR